MTHASTVSPRRTHHAMGAPDEFEMMRRRRRRVGRRRATLDALLFLAPFLAVYLLFLIVPVVQAFLMSGFRWDLLSGQTTFVGLENYVRMLGGTRLTWSPDNAWPARLALTVVGGGLTLLSFRRSRRLRAPISIAVVTAALVALLGVHPGAGGGWNDPNFWTSLQNTVYFTAASTPILVALGLALAVALNMTHRGTAVYRAVFFLPYVLPISAVTLIWSYLLNPDRGLIGGVLSALGLPEIQFLSDPQLAMPSIIATTVWWSVGFNMVLFLAGLQDVEPSLLEAAAIDGANRWQRFRHITVPGLSNVTVLVVVTQLVASFQIFGQVYIMTKGGPGTSTIVVIQRIYEAGFRDFQLGYAAAVSVFLFVVMAAVSAVQFRLLSRSS